MIWAVMFSDSDGAGMTHAESPEWIPACSMCCMMAPTTAVSPSAMQSTSTSTAPSRKRSTRMGLSGDTSAASLMYLRSSMSLYTIIMPRPPRTKDGRTRTGYPMRSAIVTASFGVTAVPASACLSPILSRSAEKNFLSSASSIDFGDVPMMGTPWRSRSAARLSGVCPPNWTMTPSGFSWSQMWSTSSSVSGSK